MKCNRKGLLFFKILAGLLLLPFGLSAQYFESGQDPASIRWKQIVSDNFQIIFPAPFEREAQRLANGLELAYAYDTYTLKNKPKKISVILHNYSAVGNAFVAWAPKRSEMFTIPPQDVYPQDWLDQLALHEYRHVVQVDKMRQGFTKILSFIFGEQAIAGIFGIYVPFWFVEGDAVVTETALSRSGRGRLPAFEMELRTQVLGRKIYSYEKAVFGSFKDFVPDHYKLGYFLVSNGRKRYGPDMWNNTLDYIARTPFNPMPFSHGLKRASGMNKWQYYRSTMRELDSLWKQQQQQVSYTAFRQLSPGNKKVYTSYQFPQWLQDSLVLAQKAGLADIQKFVLLKKDGKEEKMFTPGIFDPVWLSARKDRIVWSEYGFDKRWQNRLYYNIISYNVQTRQRKKLTQKRFLFAPSLSRDATRIAAVEVLPENKYTFVLLDAETGKELKRIAHPQNAFLLTPTWSEDGRSIVAIILTPQGKSIVMVDTETGSFEQVLPFTYQEISQPVKFGNHIYYHGTYSGIDNIYALDLRSSEVYQVTSSVYGAFDPAVSPDGKKLLYSDYSPLGFNVAEIALQPEQWVPLSEVKNNSMKLYEVCALQEKGVVPFDSVIPVTYPVKKYSKFSHLFNPHSWMPFTLDASALANPGASLLFQNKLSTLSGTLGYGYNYNERMSGFTADITYKAWYPLISLTAGMGGRASSYTDGEGKAQSYTWQEKNVGLGVSQPLNLTRGKYIRSITPSVNADLIELSKIVNAPPGLAEGRITSLNYDLRGSRTLKMAPRDLRPRWGQQFLVNYQHAPYSDLSVRSMFTVQAQLYFPGILKHHSLQVRLADQRQSAGRYTFTSPIFYIRGIRSRINNSEFRKISVDYRLPLLYPDLRLGPIVYLKRIKTNLFYDYGIGLNKKVNYLYQSTGVELTTDIYLFNFLAPFEIGFRYSYLPYSARQVVEFLYTINISQI